MESGALLTFGGALDCNVCHTEINSGMDSFFTCTDTCDFDICHGCMTCQGNSQLYKKSDAAVATHAIC